MIETRFPNRWFGSNPQAITSQGKKLTAFDREVPRDWRSALGLPNEAGPTRAVGTGTASSD